MVVQDGMLKNVTEEIVIGLVGFHLRGASYQTFCHCEPCERKIIATALNKLPNYYVTTESDRNRAFQYLNTDEQVEKINNAIIHAIYQVGQAPGHK